MTVDFIKALDKAGLRTKEIIIADGRLRRFHVDGDSPGSKNGWYVLYSDGLAAGSFGSWKTGGKEIWCAKTDRQMTPAERTEFSRRMDEARKAREADEQARRAEARDKALSIWKASPPAPENHPYLLKKGVHNYGLRLSRGALVIPLRDSAGTLHSLQFIDGLGAKRFLSGGRIKGCYFPIGRPTDTLCATEGYATAASVYEATGHATAVAFNAGNLEPVARVLRRKFPAAKIVVCADDDETTIGNPGLSKATAAALAVGGLIAIAEFRT